MQAPFHQIAWQQKMQFTFFIDFSLIKDTESVHSLYISYTFSAMDLRDKSKKNKLFGGVDLWKT